MSLGFSETVRIVVTSEQWLTKGVQGITGIPKLMTFLGSGLTQSVAVLTLLIALMRSQDSRTAVLRDPRLAE